MRRIPIIQPMGLFDEAKLAREGSNDFRENAAYSWSWLVAHAKELNTTIEKLNLLISKSNTIDEDIGTIVNSAREIRTSIDYARNLTSLLDYKNEMISIHKNIEEIINAKNIVLQLISRLESVVTPDIKDNELELRICNLEQKSITNQMKNSINFKILKGE